jgi:hypothetical protein
MYNSGFMSLVSGDLDVACLKTAVDMMCQRHEVCGWLCVTCMLSSRC